MVKKWGAIARFARQFGEPFVEVVAGWERAGHLDVYTALREVRQLYTLEARERLFAGLQSGVKPAAVDKHIAKLALRQWVDWQWSPSQPLIHSSVGVLSYLLVLRWLVVSLGIRNRTTCIPSPLHFSYNVSGFAFGISLSV